METTNTDSINLTQQKELTLEEKLTNVRTSWQSRVKEMSTKLKGLPNIIELQYEIYSYRQDAVEYYSYLMSVGNKLNKEYKVKSSRLMDSLKTQSDIRYNNQDQIEGKIEGTLADDIYLIKLFEIHAKYMQETIKTIDNLIYGINYRVQIEQLMKGIK